MKNFTLTLCKTVLLCFTVLYSYSQTTVASYNFNGANAQGWTNAGSFAYLTNNNTYRCDARGALVLRYGYGRWYNGRRDYSIWTSPQLDLSPYNQASISFCMTSINVDNGEGFDLIYNDGTGWVILEDYRRQVEFNASTSNGQTFTFTLTDANYNLTNNSRFGFINRCNQTNEYVVIDDVEILGYSANEPEIEVTDGTNVINDNDFTPSVINSTDFGTVNVGNSVTQTFTINNNGNQPLNLTDNPIVDISGNAAFSIITQPASTVAPGGSTTFTVQFTPTADGVVQADISIANNDTDEDPYNFTIEGNGYIAPAEISITGNSIPISDEDYFSNAADGTYFETVNVGSSQTQTFVITNTGQLPLYLTGNPIVDITGDAEFSITSNPATTIAPGDSTSFTVEFTPSSDNYFYAIISIANNDSNENSYDFLVDGYGEFSPAEINVTGNSITINDGDNIPNTNDGTDFGEVGNNTTVTHTFTIENTGIASSVITLTGSPLVNITGSADFTITTQPATNTINGGNSVTFQISFTPTSAGTETAVISIDNTDNDEDPYNFTISGIGNIPLSVAPGGVTANLKLWLKANDSTNYNDGDRVSIWDDQGRGADATANFPEQRPTYRDNSVKNVNYNPVIEFDNNSQTIPLDDDYSYDNLDTQFLQGTAGFYTQDMFIVIIPDDTEINSTFGDMDVFCGDADPNDDETDATGIGLGKYTGRVDDEVICYAYDTYTQDEDGDGYAVYDASNRTYNNVGIINTRNNVAETQQELYYNANNIETGQNDIAEFDNAIDTRYWIGRSEGWEASTNARIAEIITYSTRQVDTDLTLQRNRIQSYLAVKYGITLGVNGTTQDYVDSDGSVIWDQSENQNYNYDIAGIGRDDDSALLQKQSRSVNNATDGLGRTEGVLSMGLTDIYETNNLNIDNNTANTFTNKSFLVWGNNGADLNTPSPEITVDMSIDIADPSLETNVSFSPISRVWKVVETGGDVETVKISVFKDAIRTATPPDGRYLMFISQNGNFGPTADYRVMREEGDNIVTEYDFTGTEYITFGWAPERVFERSVYFDATNRDHIEVGKHLNLNTQFTMSAWVNRSGATNTASIISKRDNKPNGGNHTVGYDFGIDNEKFRVSWYDNTNTFRSITSNTSIPANQWHQLAIIHDGTTAYLYIDGILDTRADLSGPQNTNEDFIIGAGDKGDLDNLFDGNIDEVRVWSTNLTVDQLHFVMNQELQKNGNFVNGRYFYDEGIVPTKNDISNVPWAALEAYYPMSTYTYTNTKDESGNGLQGALKNLKTVDWQTAPLPYKSESNGSWTNNTVWTNGNLQTIPGDISIVDNTQTIDWNIVETAHNLTINSSTLPAVEGQRNRTLLALKVNTNTVTVNGSNDTNSGYGLTITHYLEMDGDITLKGESQLVQTLNSDLAVTSAGKLTRDQQGTRDLYTYNYWSSPVSVQQTTQLNTSYKLPQVFFDGTTDTPEAINFISGYNGTWGESLGIADYWIWKFSNRTSDDYASWQHVRSTGDIFAGEGFTMKGVQNTNENVSLEQNYTFVGKPNNGDISLSINAGNDYLVGNPYPSAIDADQFIRDNAPTIDATGNTTGTLYFWEHWGGGSHNLADYQGGYATYNLSGATVAAQFGTNDPDVGTGGTALKRPGKYIPVGQGFFVTGENTGSVRFNNGQRIFRKEDGTNSIFVRNSSVINANRNTESTDNRLKIRLGFNSVNTIRRQLLVTQDENATMDYDWGYDAELKENQMDDMYWMIDNNQYVIQGVNTINDTTILPLGIHVDDAGENTITIDALENAPDNIEIYLYDSVEDTYHDLRESDFTINLDAGSYTDRFALTFSNQRLSNESFDTSITGVTVIVNDDTNTLKITNTNKTLDLKDVAVFNILGQNIMYFNNQDNLKEISLSTNGLSTGVYIVKSNTNTNAKLSKKIIIK